MSTPIHGSRKQRLNKNEIIKHTEIKCEGIYSHFATADEGDLSYAFDQEKKFKRILDLAKKLDYKINNIPFN